MVGRVYRGFVGAGSERSAAARAAAIRRDRDAVQHAAGMVLDQHPVTGAAVAQRAVDTFVEQLADTLLAVVDRLDELHDAAIADGGHGSDRPAAGTASAASPASDRRPTRRDRSSQRWSGPPGQQGGAATITPAIAAHSLGAFGTARRRLPGEDDAPR